MSRLILRNKKMEEDIKNILLVIVFITTITLIVAIAVAYKLECFFWQ
jgi:heme/copper-type cytochrome/quinol oxidase subunit 2